MDDRLEKKPRISRGGKNLMILGILAAIIVLVSTGISLMIYHNSGDIYLDRSRPGFLPDEEEIEQNEVEVEDYSFDKSGKITPEVIRQYIDELEAEIRTIDSYEKPFNMEVISDDRLGIPN